MALPLTSAWQPSENRWEVGFGVNGIANRIEWADVERTDYFLSSLVGGGDFNDLPAVLGPASRVELPVDVRANAAYNADAFTVIAEFANGFNGTTFRGGYEHKFNRVQLRGGGRSSRIGSNQPVASASTFPIA